MRALPFLLALCACSGEETTVDEDVPRDFAPRTCTPPASGGTPTTIADTVAFIDALEHPVTVPCFLQALDRPLALKASRNTFSAQPALASNNPRFLIETPGFVITVVTKGEGRGLIEFAEETEPGMSIKAEIKFPVEASPLTPEEPYTTVINTDGSGTRCAFCHMEEERVDSIDFTAAYVSERLDPLPNEVVDPEYVDWAWRSCEPDIEPDRCNMFDAIFAHGDVNFLE